MQCPVKDTCTTPAYVKNEKNGVQISQTVTVTKPFNAAVSDKRKID